MCVTGATGFIAGHLIKQLLEKGYKVRGTVRNANRSRIRLSHLWKFCKTEEQLELFEADLTINNSFDEAINGVKYVFHVASPFKLTAKNPETELIIPAVNGVLNVLSSCSKTESVERVILTSSIAAIYGWPNDIPDGMYFTENHWNKTSSIQHGPYYYSKLRAEQSAWEFIEKNKNEIKFDLVAINPSVVIGPMLDTHIGTSLKLVKDINQGKFPFAVPRLGFGFVDVRDVATAHILAAENKSASGRYICHSQSLSVHQMCEILLRHYPNFPIPKRELPDFVVYAGNKFWRDERYTTYDFERSLGKIPLFDNTKIQKELSMQFIDIEQSLVDTTESLIHHQILNRNFQKSILAKL